MATAPTEMRRPVFCFVDQLKRRDGHMIVVGVDPHKRSHTCAAVAAGTGELRSSEAVAATTAGLEDVLGWARRLDGQRVWAVEDCRHVSGRLERFLLARGERVVRVASRLTAGRRRASRHRGKSDPIDALAVARAAVQEGVETLPVAVLDGPARDVKLLLDYRDALIAERTRTTNRLRWLLHDAWPELELPRSALTNPAALQRLARRLATAPQTTDVRVMRAHVRHLRHLTRQTTDLRDELTVLVTALQPQLLTLPGVGPLTAAKLIAEIAGIDRVRSEAKLARLAGIAPIPASSGSHHRMRLDRGGNRQLNAAIHRIAITQLRHHQPAQHYLTRRLTDGKTKREAIRCLKRHLVRAIYRTMTPTPALT